MRICSEEARFNTMKINKNVIWMGMSLIILLVAGFFLVGGTGNVSGAIISGVTANTDEVQIVKMHVEGSKYILEPSTVKKGIPVRLEADISRMPGCSKSVISSELGITKTFNSASNTIEFTPNKAGTFYLACSMNMYKGTLSVLEVDGSKSSYVQTTVASGSMCGAGGGCGCGSR